MRCSVNELKKLPLKYQFQDCKRGDNTREYSYSLHLRIYIRFSQANELIEHVDK